MSAELPSKSYKAIRFSEGKESSVEDLLVIEESILINVNYQPFTLTMRSPGHEEDLVRGILFTENLLPKGAPFNMSVAEKNRGIITSVNVEIPRDLLGSNVLDKRNLLSVSSCGICGKIEKNDFLHDKEPIVVHQKLAPDLIHHMFSQLEAQQELFKTTGGCHGVGAFDRFGKLLVVREDIGRHNATDKVIGALLRSNTLADANVLIVSGRVSYEIVSKAFMAGIPFLIAVSAPSSMAVDLASELGITLIAFYRGDRYSCYSNFENLNLES